MHSGWLWAFVLAGMAIFLVSLFKPRWGLALALVALYNPYYIYRFLMTAAWEGARIRAGVSVLLLAVLGLSVLVRTAILGKQITRVTTPIDQWLYLFAIFPVISLIVGLVAGNDRRLILADAFPVVEFYAYFLITTMIVKDKAQARAVLWTVVVGGTGAALSLVIVYFLRWESFLATFRWSSGTIIPRLVDFTPSVLVPVSVGLYLYAHTRIARTILLVSSNVFVVSIALGFWRSQWLGLLGTAAFILWQSRGLLARVAERLGLFTTTLILTLTLVSILGTNLGIFPTSFFSLAWARATGQAWARVTGLDPIEEEGGRIEEAIALFRVVQSSPLVGRGLGGTFVTPAHTGVLRDLPIGSAHEYYLLIAALMGLPALAVFLAVNLVVFREGLRGVMSLGWGMDRGIVLGSLASLVSTGITFATQPPVLHFPLLAYLGAVVALMFIVLRDDPSSVPNACERAGVDAHPLFSANSGTLDARRVGGNLAVSLAFESVESNR